MADLWPLLVHGYSPSVLEFGGTLLIQLLFFWLPSLAYLSLPALAPRFSHRHKLQPAPEPPSPAQLRDCLRIVLRNQSLSIVIHLALLCLGSWAGRGPTYRFDVVPPPWREIVRDVLVCMALREVSFYYIHRFLHLPHIYAKVHKLHHRFTAPVALAAQYAHPFEHLLANTLPISLPPMVSGVHVLTFWVFLALELLETTTVHSGYDFLGGVARAHDEHHERFRVNFGTVGVLDWVHGTDGRGKQKAL